MFLASLVVGKAISPFCKRRGIAGSLVLRHPCSRSRFKMYAVGRYISQGVYTVAGPFHPFGGAVDIIVVEQEDGTFKSTPWNVKFGKFQGVLKRSEKIVDIAVNDVAAPFHMYMDQKGEAYFLKDVEGGNKEDKVLSPPSNPSSGDETTVEPLAIEDSKPEEEQAAKVAWQTAADEELRKQLETAAEFDLKELIEEEPETEGRGKGSLVLRTQNSAGLPQQFELVVGFPDEESLNAVRRETKDSTHLQKLGDAPSVSDKEAFEGDSAQASAGEQAGLVSSRDSEGSETSVQGGDPSLHATSGSALHNSGADLVATGAQSGETGDKTSTAIHSLLNRAVGLNSPLSRPATALVANAALNSLTNAVSRADISPEGTHKTDAPEEQKVENLEFTSEVAASHEPSKDSQSQTINGTDEASLTAGVPVNEIETAAVENPVVSGSEITEEEAVKGSETEVVDPDSAGQLALGSNAFGVSGVEISLCRHLLTEGMGVEAAAKAFDSAIVSLDTFRKSPVTITSNGKLVIKLCGHYYPWTTAAPIVLGMLAFGQVIIPETNFGGAIKVEATESKPATGTLVPTASGGWTLWPFTSRRQKTPQKGSIPQLTSEELLVAADIAIENPLTQELLRKNGYYKRLRKNKVRTNIPTSEQLATLNLKEGKNTITFTFMTRVLGKQQVDARIYLWKWNTRVVISDVDGTITKSDVLGQVLFLVGKDWTQSGVARLFSAIKENGYELMFLSARSISQAYITRQFLLNLKQDGEPLPDGPVVISPDGLFPSLYREVIRRAPHEFKIACLQEIRSLFPSECNPFYAGFGNRETDAISYLKVGIPKGKIFIINPKGEVVVNNLADVRTYTSLHKLVDEMFPAKTTYLLEDYNSWNFWKMPLPDIEDEISSNSKSLALTTKKGAK